MKKKPVTDRFEISLQRVLPESNRPIRIQASRELWWWFYIAPS